MSPAIEVDGLRKVFPASGLEGEVRAVDGVSLRVARGEIFGFLGRNGAGKTTTVKILLNMITRYEGTARLLGCDAQRTEARRNVGYLAETPLFPRHLRAHELLELHGRMAGMSASDAKRQAAELLARLGLAAASDRRVRKFSKGMMQRVGLGVALMGRPELVFLDEPTANLDPVGRREVRDLLLEQRGMGATILINSHMLSEIEMTCDRVAIVDAGRLVREGTVDELTQISHTVHIGVTNATDELLAALAHQLGEARWVDGHIVAEIQSESDLDPIPSIVEQCGQRLRYLAMARTSLEDAFLSAVGAATAQAEGERAP